MCCSFPLGEEARDGSEVILGKQALVCTLPFCSETAPIATCLHVFCLQYGHSKMSSEPNTAKTVPSLGYCTTR